MWIYIFTIIKEHAKSLWYIPTHFYLKEPYYSLNKKWKNDLFFFKSLEWWYLEEILALELTL